MDLGSGIATTADMMGTNMSGWGDDRLERQKTETANQYNIAFWEAQNAYNDPSAQMQRLKNAGLNPNLMYGKGTVGNAESGKPAERPAQSRPKEFNMLEGYTAMMQNELIPYQKDLLKVQLKNEILKEQIGGEELKRKMTENYILDYSKNGQAMLKEYSGQKMHNDWLMQNQTWDTRKEQVEKQEKIQDLQIKLLTGQIDMQKYELNLNRIGLQKNDPWVLRTWRTNFTRTDEDVKPKWGQKTFKEQLEEFKNRKRTGSGKGLYY